MQNAKRQFYQHQVELADELVRIQQTRAWKEIDKRVNAEEEEIFRKLIHGKNISTNRMLTLRGEARAWTLFRKIITSILKKRGAAVAALEMEE